MSWSAGTLIRVLQRFSHRLDGLFLLPHRNVSPAPEGRHRHAETVKTDD